MILKDFKHYISSSNVALDTGDMYKCYILSVIGRF